MKTIEISKELAIDIILRFCNINQIYFNKVDNWFDESDYDSWDNSIANNLKLLSDKELEELLLLI